MNTYERWNVDQEINIQVDSKGDDFGLHNQIQSVHFGKVNITKHFDCVTWFDDDGEIDDHVESVFRVWAS